MKKIFFAIVALIFSANFANAQFAGPDGGPNAAMTVKQALSMGDDTRVVLQGSIINSLGDEKYTFKDATGEIVIEIDDEDWHGVKVTPENVLEIRGEIDKDFARAPVVDVDSFVIKQ